MYCGWSGVTLSASDWSAQSLDGLADVVLLAVVVEDESAPEVPDGSSDCDVVGASLDSVSSDVAAAAVDSESSSPPPMDRTIQTISASTTTAAPMASARRRQ